MKIYISGKITGLNIEVARANFKRAEAMLQAHGYETVNPFDNGVDEDAPWEHHMEADIKDMLQCEGIYQMGNWRQSRGAKVEYKEARAAGLVIFRLTNGELKRNKW